MNPESAERSLRAFAARSFAPPRLELLRGDLYHSWIGVWLRLATSGFGCSAAAMRGRFIALYDSSVVTLRDLRLIERSAASLISYCRHSLHPHSHDLAIDGCHRLGQRVLGNGRFRCCYHLHADRCEARSKLSGMEDLEGLEGLEGNEASLQALHSSS